MLGKPGPYLLGLACIERNGGFRTDNLKTYGGASDSRILVSPGDLIVSLKDVTQAADLLGAAVRVPDAIREGRLTQDTVKLVFANNPDAKEYIYWLLRTPEARRHCRSFATGTTNLGLARLDFLSLAIPPLTEQRRHLIETLSALDDKIELNGRMNETLEASARALFRDWFVDFGPTRAKMAGQPAWLAPDLWFLFPDRLDDDGTPEGWVSYTVADLANQHTVSISPLDCASEPFEHYSLPAFDNGQFPALEFGGSIKSNKTVVPDHAILLSKLNPEISRVWLPNPNGGVRQIASTEFLAFVPKPRIGRSLVYSLFCDPTFRQTLEGMVTGTSKSHQRISPPALRSLAVLRGSRRAFAFFDQKASPLIEQMLANRLESRSLAETRDMLLPKLMSGAVRVRDAERAVAALC